MCVLPEPVCPYENKHTLYPSSADCTRLETSSKTSSCRDADRTPCRVEHRGAAEAVDDGDAVAVDGVHRERTRRDPGAGVGREPTPPREDATLAPGAPGRRRGRSPELLNLVAARACLVRLQELRPRSAIPRAPPLPRRDGFVRLARPARRRVTASTSLFAATSASVRFSSVAPSAFASPRSPRGAARSRRPSRWRRRRRREPSPPPSVTARAAPPSRKPWRRSPRESSAKARSLSSCATTPSRRVLCSSAVCSASATRDADLVRGKLRRPPPRNRPTRAPPPPRRRAPRAELLRGERGGHRLLRLRLLGRESRVPRRLELSPELLERRRRASLELRRDGVTARLRGGVERRLELRHRARLLRRRRLHRRRERRVERRRVPRLELGFLRGERGVGAARRAARSSATAARVSRRARRAAPRAPPDVRGAPPASLSCDASVEESSARSAASSVARAAAFSSAAFASASLASASASAVCSEVELEGAQRRLPRLRLRFASASVAPPRRATPRRPS